MDFTYGAKEEAFRSELRAWLDANVPKRDRLPVDGTEDPAEGWNRRIKWYKQLASGGWGCVHWPKEYGGRGLSLMERVVFNEELDRINTPFPYVGSGPGLIGPVIMHWGTDEHKARYLDKIVKGEEFWCQGFSEPNAGSDLASVQTRAVEDGDYFVINGQKIWTSNAQFADLIFVLCKTDPEAPKHRALSFIIADMKTPGITVRPLVQMTGAQGFNEVFFDDVRVPKKNLLGNKNEGWQVAVTTLMYERNTSGAMYNTESLVGELAGLVRMLDRNGGPASADASVRQKVAQFKCEAAALRYTGLRQLTRQLKGLPPGPEGSIMKLCASDLNLRIQLFAMELLGSYSQMILHAPMAIDEGRWLQRMLWAREGTIAAGSNEIQHNIIGERVLGLPKG